MLVSSITYHFEFRPPKSLLMDLQNAYSVLLFISLLEKVFKKTNKTKQKNGTYHFTTLSLLKELVSR